ncbi:leucyl aminopeptidase [Corynebacterium sp.]|uniref:leucyl aminopeptidase n=1 Tax=Corynebacterium sp. TaxID=1720 RepID=UPI0039C8A8BF
MPPRRKVRFITVSAPNFTLSLPARGSILELAFATSVPAQTGALLVPVARGEDSLEIPVTALGTDSLLSDLKALGATGKHGEITRVLRDGTLTIAFGLGDTDDIDAEAVRRAAGVLARNLNGVAQATITTEFGVRPIVEGLVLGGYAYSGLKGSGPDVGSDEDSATPDAITVTVVGSDAARDEFERALIVAESTALARDLVNTPANILYPESYATVIREIAEQSGLEVEVFDEAELEAQGFGGILAVGKGSVRPPRLVHLTWKPNNATTSIALVGKGITFDTGGISLKPAPNMEDMISDMGGSAAVVAAMSAAARLNTPARIEAWVPLAENMPSGSATHPGDVITHYGGITSEILNTDAEGRLVLADALARASEDNPDYLIETATLTGAQLVALGTRTAGVMGSDEFRDRVAEIGRSVGENAWAMPLLEEQEKELSSPVADIRNVHNSRMGGMVFAGLYLSRFIADDTQWVHLDVAGPAWNGSSPWGYTPKRATGAPVRTIVETLTELATR